MVEKVLTLVQATRDRIAVLTAAVDGAKETCAHLTDSVEARTSALGVSYQAAVAHLEAERARAAAARERLSQRLQAMGQALGEDAAHLLTNADPLRRALDALGQVVAADEQNLEGLRDQLVAQLHDAEALILEETTRVNADIHDHLAEVQASLLQVLETTSAQAVEVTDAVQATMRSGTETDLAHVSEAFVGQARSAATGLQQALVQGADTMRQHASRQVESAGEAYSQRREAWSAEAERLQNGLHALAQMLGEDGATLVQGANDATELMTATNVGARAVLGVLDNVKHIFDDLIAM